MALVREGHVFNNGDLNSYLRVVTEDPEVSFRALVQSGRQRNFGKKMLAPKTVNQRRYLEAIERNDLVFGIGPAGTGKTYLAVAMAVSALLSKRVSRIILTRPAVEAGERLGFLPGTLQEKVDPYLRPLYDALYDMMESEKVDKLLERNTIEVAPIAFMRGRTLNDSFIILDEAQNSTTEQMKMVLTRTGFNSKMVVNGDITQIDLPAGKRSGLIDALEVLRGVEGISFVQFDERDVVRHNLVQRIVKAYERYNEAIGAGRQLSLKLTEPTRRNGSRSMSASDDQYSFVPPGSGGTEPPQPGTLRPNSARRSRQRRRLHVPHHRRRRTPPPQSRLPAAKITPPTSSRSRPSGAYRIPSAKSPSPLARARAQAAAIRPLPRKRNPHPDAARPPAPARHGSRNRPRPNGARRNPLAQAPGPARRPDRTAARMTAVALAILDRIARLPRWAW